MEGTVLDSLISGIIKEDILDFSESLSMYVPLDIEMRTQYCC